MFEKLINEIKGLSTIDFKDATEKIRTINEQIQNIAQKKDTLCRRMYN